MIEVNDKIRAKVEALPDSPGVYRWKDMALSSMSESKELKKQGSFLCQRGQESFA